MLSYFDMRCKIMAGTIPGKIQMGDCQNYGPFLVPLNEAPYYNGDQKNDHNFDKWQLARSILSLASMTNLTVQGERRQTQGYVGAIALHRDDIGIMKSKMETTTVDWNHTTAAESSTLQAGQGK